MRWVSDYIAWMSVTLIFKAIFENTQNALWLVPAFLGLWMMLGAIINFRRCEQQEFYLEGGIEKYDSDPGK